MTYAVQSESKARSHQRWLSFVPLGAMKRFDVKTLYKALDAQRRSRGLSWPEVADEIGVNVAT